jgi:hypothetical protein
MISPVFEASETAAPELLSYTGARDDWFLRSLRRVTADTAADTFLQDLESLGSKQPNTRLAARRRAVFCDLGRSFLTQSTGVRLAPFGVRKRKYVTFVGPHMRLDRAALRNALRDALFMCCDGPQVAQWVDASAIFVNGTVARLVLTVAGQRFDTAMGWCQ